MLNIIQFCCCEEVFCRSCPVPTSQYRGVRNVFVGNQDVKQYYIRWHKEKAAPDQNHIHTVELMEDYLER